MKLTKFLCLLFLSFIIQNTLFAQNAFQQESDLFATDGFFKLKDNEQRQVFSFNNGWLYHKGALDHAEINHYKDQDWTEVQLPHGLDILPENVSGGANFQGIVWYRKHFTLPNSIKNKHITLTFEAIMGKCTIFLNGEKLCSHKGGYLPIVLDLSKANILWDQENTIAVMADNSDDPNYPPGKAQYGLDFCYYGGIYRDAWLVATENIYITNPNLVHKVAGGGVIVSFDKVSEQNALISVSTDIQNDKKINSKIIYEVQIIDKNGKIVAKKEQKNELLAGKDQSISSTLSLKKPLLWDPDHPYLYQMHTLIKNQQGVIIDGYFQKIGIKSVELKGKEGLFLNGKAYQDKLIGANHHQDYALIGNAVPNNLSWNDAEKLKNAGIKILRLSHYPQDPAFMDACDALGIFTIVAIPGWQFWNNENPAFETLMLEDVRQTIRRDRNHASVFAWEPIPNETFYPASFAEKTYQTNHQEYPFKNCIAACDFGHPKWEIFDLIYAHPFENAQNKTDKNIFTREWGDNVDDWNSHNSPSRAAMAWGENPQLIQAKHYSNPDYFYTSWENLYEAPKQHIGGALWHAFDNGRGYHPDLFYGGILDPFRQEKYSYKLFQSQKNPESYYTKVNKEEKYQLFIANILSPFSAKDITVYSNCDSVKLIAYGKDTLVLSPDKNLKMPHPPLVFKDVFNFMKVKSDPPPSKDGNAKSNQIQQIEAIGYAHGKEVIKTIQYPSKRASKIHLKMEMKPANIIADGSTIIPIIAEMQDENGIIKRLNETEIQFEIEGEGILIGDGIAEINPRKITWGTAPALIKTTLQAGTIKIIAKPLFVGTQTPKADTLIIKSVKAQLPSIYNKDAVSQIKTQKKNLLDAPKATQKITEQERKKMLKKVAEDQSKFMHIN